jgi:hypothetical protein
MATLVVSSQSAVYAVNLQKFLTTKFPLHDFVEVSCTVKKTKLHGLQSARELYRLIDRHLSAKFSANFCGQRGVAWSAPLYKKMAGFLSRLDCEW